jgi:hypothetical protein
MGFVSWAFSEGFRSAAVLLGLLLVVGEGYRKRRRELVAHKAQTAPGGFNKTPDMYRLLGELLGVKRR